MADSKAESAYFLRPGSHFCQGLDEYFEKIRHYSHLESHFFDEFYLTLIHRFCEYVQNLREDRYQTDEFVIHTSLKQAGSLLQQLHLKYSHDTSIGKQWDLLAFAVFSSALLHNCGFIFRNRCIQIVSETGAFERDWLPFKQESPFSSGEYYRERYISSLSEDLCRDMTLWLSYELVPEISLTWLWQDQKIFNFWRSSLLSFQEGFDTLAIEFDLSKEMELNEKLRDFTVEEIQVEGMDLAEEFIQWLQVSIEDKSIDFNEKDSYLFQVQEGVLVSLDKTIQKFAEQRGASVDIDQLTDELMLTGQAFINRMAKGGSVFVSYLMRHQTGQLGRSLLSGVNNQSSVNRVTGVVINQKYLPNIPASPHHSLPDGHESNASVTRYMLNRENLKKNTGPTLKDH